MLVPPAFPKIQKNCVEIKLMYKQVEEPLLHPVFDLPLYKLLLYALSLLLSLCLMRGRKIFIFIIDCIAIIYFACPFFGQVFFLIFLTFCP